MSIVVPSTALPRVTTGRKFNRGIDMKYEQFLQSKSIIDEPTGISVVPELNPALFPFQRDIVQWALQRGRACVFADCGMGKTPMQLEWAKHIPGNVLILAPLAVAQQTVREGVKFGIEVNYCRSQSEVKPGITIANYEMLEHFDNKYFTGLVLDESSILKSYGGETRKQITEFAQSIDFRLACTATPAPNDLIELINHAEFLGIMSGKEIIALFFTQDGNTTHNWRLKGHAKKDFWRWMSQWSVAIRKPSDMGYEDGDFVLPELVYHDINVKVNKPTDGYLFAIEAQTLQERLEARRETIDDRVLDCAAIVNNSAEQFIIWCNLNSESEKLKKSIPGSVEVKGSDTVKHKEETAMKFQSGEIRVLISKPTIYGFGLNFQNCHNVVFVGLSDSYEQFYQAVRRCWRFGQIKPVNAYIITAETEGAVLNNIKRKERQSNEMFNEIVNHMKDLQINKKGRQEMNYKEDVVTGDDYTIYLGDCVEQTKRIESGSVGLTIFSPPFPGMYAYTNSSRDIGNTTSIEAMMDHFEYLIPELYRVSMPGRMCCIHLMQLTAMLNRDGYIGIKDYRGAVINAMMKHKWVYAGEVTIDKNPQIQAVRNKERGLLFKTLATDSSLMRMAMADYLIYFRKPGENPQKIQAGQSDKYNPGQGWITEEEWIEWAAPVWYRRTKHYPGGIQETDCLNVRQARDTDDERHLCPLQLGVIERAVKLWSAPGDLVFSPFTGVGSEGYQALKFGRKFVGIELKESYWRSAAENLESAKSHNQDMFKLS